MKNLLISGIICWTLALCGCAVSPSASAGAETTGFMRVRVVDGMTDEPIAGAAVVVPEAGLSCPTDSFGLTDLMELPCVPDAALTALCPLDEGRVTLIVCADGYVPYLLLYARVLPGRTRETPTVYLFADDGSLPVFQVIEAPPPEWAEGVVKRYGP